jgi:hypothetical protein
MNIKKKKKKKKKEQGGKINVVYNIFQRKIPLQTTIQVFILPTPKSPRTHSLSCLTINI